MTDMRCVEVTKPGGPEVLVETRRPIPVPAAGEILIRVKAAGVNRPDALQRTGAYKPPAGASDLPGLEAAGEIAAIGAGVSRWSVGDAVTALLPGGGYAEYVTTQADHALPIPTGYSWEQAAALCETFFTVWINVFDRGGLRAGETFLVHGGTSGIGTTAIQLAKARGARVMATAGSDEKCERCRELGADLAINYRTADFVEESKTFTDGRGLDLILDMVGGDYIPRDIKALALDGRLAMIAFLGGPMAEVNFAQVMVKRLMLTGSTLRPRSNLVKAETARAVEREVWPLLNAGTIAPVMDSTFPLSQAAQAHAHLETSTHVGKIVLVP